MLIRSSQKTLPCIHGRQLLSFHCTSERWGPLKWWYNYNILRSECKISVRELTRILFCHIFGSWAIGDSPRAEMLYGPSNMVRVKNKLISETTMLCFSKNKFPVRTWRPASFTFISAYFSCSSDRVMPVYLHPVRWTTSMAKVPQPQPISRISWSLLILAWIGQV